MGTPLNVDGPLSPCFSVGAAPLHSDPPPLRLPMGLLDNGKAIENELAIINDPLTAEERPAIVELVAQLHVATGVDDFFDLHTKLLVRYLARQRIRDELEVARTGVLAQDCTYGEELKIHKCEDFRVNRHSRLHWLQWVVRVSDPGAVDIRRPRVGDQAGPERLTGRWYPHGARHRAHPP